MIQKLIQAGFETAQDVITADNEKLTSIEGIGEKTAEKIRSACETAITKAAEERARVLTEESVPQSGEMEFSPDDEVTPKMEDY